MTRVDLHPEDLFDHLRHGDLREDERERLQRHCAVCSACAFELQLVEGSAYGSEPTADDHAIAARALERMLSGDAVDEIAPARVSGGGQLWLRAAALVLAGVLVGGSVSAAALAGSSTAGWVTWIGSWVAWTAPSEPRETKDASSATRQTRARRSAPEFERATSLAEVTTTPPRPLETPEPASAEPEPLPAATRIAPIVKPTTAAEPAVEPAAWLFRAASRARSDGRAHEAAALYAALQRDYEGSEVEIVTRVALGRLALSQLDDPDRALAAFDSYLEARPDGALAEEARSGRVSALRKLGRETEARAAAQELRSLHPHTLYVEMERTAP